MTINLKPTGELLQRAIDFLRSQPDYSRKSILRVCEIVPCSERWGYEAKNRLLKRVQETSEEMQFLKNVYSDMNWMSEIIIRAGIHKSFTTIERGLWDDIVQRHLILGEKIKELELKL